jgi:hypothetical protein
MRFFEGAEIEIFGLSEDGSKSPEALKMKRSDLIKNLRAYNKWRRGDEAAVMPEPADIGRWIDQACDELGFLDAVLAGGVEGWKKKWECAVTMAAKAENHCERVKRERDDLRDRLNDILNQPALKSCKK